MNCTVERTQDEIILRFPADTDYEAMKVELDRLHFLDLARRSQAIQGDIDEIASDLNRSHWEGIQHRFADIPEMAHLFNEEE